jgi:DNA gyrase subunit A
MPGEKISAVIRVTDYDDSNYLCMVTRKGIIKRSSLSLYKNIRKTGVYGITLDEDDELAWVRLTDGSCDLIVATKDGMSIRFSEQDARPMGRTTRGVRAIKLKKDDVVVGMSTVRDGSKLLTVTEDGKGRLTDVEDYRLQFRGGLGIRNYNCQQKGTKVAGVKAVDEADDVILISQSGIIIRMHADDIATQSRYGGGVKVMSVGEDDIVVTVARAERSDDAETVKPEAADDEDDEPYDDEAIEAEEEPEVDVLDDEETEEEVESEESDEELENEDE